MEVTNVLRGLTTAPCSGGMFGCGWALHRASEPFISVPVPTVKPRTGWIGGGALPPDTLRHEPLSVAAPPRGVAGAWGATKGAVACLSAEGWALWVHGGSPALQHSHRGYPPVGERSRRTFWQGLLLGLLGGAIGRFGVPITPADRALGNSKGESGWDARRARRQPGEQCYPAGAQCPAHQ